MLIASAMAFSSAITDIAVNWQKECYTKLILPIILNAILKLMLPIGINAILKLMLPIAFDATSATSFLKI